MTDCTANAPRIRVEALTRGNSMTYLVRRSDNIQRRYNGRFQIGKLEKSMTFEVGRLKWDDNSRQHKLFHRTRAPICVQGALTMNSLPIEPKRQGTRIHDPGSERKATILFARLLPVGIRFMCRQLE